MEVESSGRVVEVRNGSFTSPPLRASCITPFALDTTHRGAGKYAAIGGGKPCRGGSRCDGRSTPGDGIHGKNRQPAAEHPLFSHGGTLFPDDNLRTERNPIDYRSSSVAHSSSATIPAASSIRRTRSLIPINLSAPMKCSAITRAISVSSMRPPRRLTSP